jgi:hypothetical protein
MYRIFVTVGLVCLFALPALAADKAVKMRGTLRTGVVAIGAETTGIIIETRDGNYELDFGSDQQLRKKAEKLNGKTIVVAGTLNARKGIEIRERRIVTVTSLEADDRK